MKTITKSFEAAFSVYKNNITSYLKSSLLILGILFVTTFLSVWALFGRNTLKVLSAMAAGAVDPKTVLSTVQPFSILLATLVAVAGFAVVYSLFGGVVGFTAMLLKRKKINAMDVMVHIAKKRGTTLVFTRLLSVAFLFLAFVISGFVGYAIAYAVPGAGLVVLSVLQLVTFAVIGTLFLTIDQTVILEGKRSWTSLVKAYEFGKSNFLDLFILIVLFAVLSNIIGLIPVVGFLINMLVLVPISIATYTFFYIKNK